MKSVLLLIADWCPVCPGAKALWDRLKEQYNFEYEVYDISSPEGQELAKKYNITGVPTTIIDGRVVFSGIPNRDEAIASISKA